MQLIFDNLIATLIAGTIFLMVATVHARNQRIQVRAVAYSALRTQQVSFIASLRRDIAGTVCYESDLTTCPDTTVNPTTHTYSFRTRLGDDPTLHKVVYKRRKVGELNDGAPLYQILRFVDPTGTLDPANADGGSASIITSWSVRALNVSGMDPDKPLDIRQIEVRFEIVPPFAIGDDDVKTHPWKATYRPRKLQEDTTV